VWNEAFNKENFWCLGGRGFLFVNLFLFVIELV